MFALIPFLLLFYLYTRYEPGTDRIAVSPARFTVIIVLVGVGSLSGFLAMRSTLRKYVLLAENVRKSVLENIDRDIVYKLSREEGEVADLARSFNDIIVRLEGNVRELEQTKRALHDVLAKVGRALSSMENFDTLLKLILETALDALGARNGAIFAGDEGDEYELKTWVGWENMDRNDVISTTAPYLEWVVKQKSPFVQPMLEEKAREGTAPVSPLVCLPLSIRGRLQGALCLSGSTLGRNFSEDEINILHNLSTQMAISFENFQLNQDRERAYFETISALALAVEARDQYSRGHSERVGEYAEKIGRSMGLSEKDLLALRDASRLHDIGKIGITDEILKKPGNLTKDEMQIMKRHPAIGETIVAPLKTFNHLLDPIRHHHEYLDGSGYPDGLQGDQIPLITRIMVVADIYDALIGDRPYRKAFSEENTRKEIDRLVERGKLDRDVVGHLYRMLGAEGESVQTTTA